MKQKLGQHFLRNKNKLKKIVDALELKSGDVVIEIGSGHGELTEEIVTNDKRHEVKIIAIEKDEALAKKFSEKFQFSLLRQGFRQREGFGGQVGGQAIFPASQDLPKRDNFQSLNNKTIIIGDVLKILPQIISRYKLPSFAKASTGRQVTSYKLVGNIPYYITGRLLRVLSELENKPSLIVLTVQKEVARRIMALKPSSLNSHGRVRARPPEWFRLAGRVADLPAEASVQVGGQRPEARNSYAMNLLSAIVQYWAEPEIIGYISKNDFKPIPKVDSAIIQLTTHNQQPTTEEADKYYKFVRVLFKQPRKTILNNLATSDKRQGEKEEIIKKLQSLRVNPNDRPQNLSLEQIRQLSTLF